MKEKADSEKCTDLSEEDEEGEELDGPREHPEQGEDAARPPPHDLFPPPLRDLGESLHVRETAREAFPAAQYEGSDARREEPQREAEQP